MTHEHPEARTPRSRAEYRWTPRKAHAFLEALALHGKVAAAARAVGMTRQSAYKLKQRIPVVAERWARAQAIGRARPRHGDGFGPPWPMRTLGPFAAKTKVTELAQNLQDSVRCVNTPCRTRRRSGCIHIWPSPLAGEGWERGRPRSGRLRPARPQRRQCRRPLSLRT